MSRTYPARAAVAGLCLVACSAVALAGCAAPEKPGPLAPARQQGGLVAPASGAAPPPAPGPVRASVVPAAPAPAPGCGDQAGWSCVQQARFASASAYAARVVRPHGYLGAVFTDRDTGRSWRYGATDHPGWTASTIKLAMAADILGRSRAAALVLSGADRRDMDSMLNSSDEAASDRLWKKFGGADMLARFRTRLAMPNTHFVPGFTARPYWGFVKTTTDDLAALVHYVLTSTDPADRGYLVAALRGVAPNQRWGVWAAGPGEQPGNKDGWSDEQDDYGRHWVTNTVGFAGPHERYLVAVTYQVNPGAGLADGVHAVSDLVALLFGNPVPAPVTVPVPDG